ncbi:hypothetical protein F4054_09125 [Candidatus Poribacteria bacterium]|nr:hypothetical protein [Candidatus Poribacteria bacterium]MYG08421.1 hypothetical protein [Candidatus Poribacteria bacterium]MYK22410.1 hypothetical protein [Candidatus Poribacteria bacterium]
MNQERFEELLLNQLSEISGRISSMDERVSSMDERMSFMDERMSSVENRRSSLEQGMAWVRGRLEGRGEFWADIKSWIAIVVAVAAIIFAWLK